tara:strand:+ start:50639 stop:52039 length:1401 start_codon:yes stop_codon:yes gene_type:complete
MMDIGRRSMQNSSTGLQTVGHNIANKNTEGYSRQRVDFQTNEPVGFGKHRIGMGARPGAVNRISNPYLERQLEKEGGELGYSEAKAEAMSKIEQVYNEQVNKGLNKYMGEFFNSFRELSNNPESLASRTLVKESADFLAKDFKRVDDQLQDVQKDVDYQLAAHVEEVNNITAEIADLNEKVQVVTLQGGAANDERDRRDLLVKKLSSLVNIRYAENNEGHLNVTAGDSAVLVSGYSHRKLSVGSSSGREGKREGNFDVYYHPTESSKPVTVTSQMRGGRMGALIEVRDQVVNEFRNKVDTMAYSITKSINRAHSMGYDRNNVKGKNLFEDNGRVENAAQNMMVNKEIMRDVSKIVAAAEPNAPADNRVANVLSSLQYQKTMDDFDFDEFYNSMVGQVGIMTAKAMNAENSQSDIVKQLNNLRESVSGVSLDEETTKMIEFQKAFDASARLITTADEMMDTVLSLKR